MKVRVDCMETVDANSSTWRNQTEDLFASRTIIQYIQREITNIIISYNFKHRKIIYKSYKKNYL